MSLVGNGARESLPWKNALPTPLPTLPHEDVARIDIRMIIRKKIECHGGNFRQQLVKRRCVGRSRDVVAVPAPHRRLLVPSGRNCEDDRFGHDGPQLGAIASKSTITFQAM